MTLYYVASDGDNSDGLTWAKAFTTFAGAVTAATGDGDTIYVDQGFTDTLSAAATYTFGNNVNVICSNDKSNEPPQTLGTMGVNNWIGHDSSTRTIDVNGAYRVFISGLTFRIAGSSSASMTIGSSDGAHLELENCYLWLGTTGTGNIIIGGSASSSNNYINLSNTTFRFGATGHGITNHSNSSFLGCVISSDGSTPSVLLKASSSGCLIQCVGCDLSVVTGTLIASQTNRATEFQFIHCKLGSGVAILASQTPANKSSAHAWLYNCSAGDEHYNLQYHDAFGSTVIDTGIYANNGASYDGTNRCSWKIVTTANCSYTTPYVSPWIDCYHSGTSAITPSLEIVRSGSATAYQNDEVWGEFSYQGTSGFPLATIVSDRKALLAAAADQTTGALDASGWTGENATSWFGKLNPTSAITPAEIGHLRARVVVGEPSITVHVDPTIRGRS
jgi:hypothetical protein